jgi:transposase InsO family protein
MNIHSNARTCPNSRAVIVQHAEAAAWSEDQAAAMGITARTGYKWLRRYREEGSSGLQDRSSRPHSISGLTPENRAALVVRLRECRLTAAEIARKLRMPRSTVSAIVKRAGLSRIEYLDPPEPVVRYERDAPGDLVHLDIKKLGRIGKVGHRVTGDRRDRTRGAGWEYVHVAIDDMSRLAYVEVLANEQADTTMGLLKRVLIFFRRHGITVRRIMTDNGSAYVSHVFAALCQQNALKHLRTRPYRPCTNGKAERFIQTLLREWAYKRPYRSSRARTVTLPRWLFRYNHHRPHASLGGTSPITRVEAQC